MWFSLHFVELYQSYTNTILSSDFVQDFICHNRVVLLRSLNRFVGRSTDLQDLTDSCDISPTFLTVPSVALTLVQLTYLTPRSSCLLISIHICQQLLKWLRMRYKFHMARSVIFEYSKIGVKKYLSDRSIRTNQWIIR